MAQHPDAVGEVFNIGTDEAITMRALAELVKTLTRSPSEIRYIPYAEAYGEEFEDMQQRVPDLRKIQGLYGYTPKHDLQDIVEDVIAAFQQGASG